MQIISLTSADDAARVGRTSAVLARRAADVRAVVGAVASSD